MSIVVRFAPASLTAQKYDEAFKRVNDTLGLGGSPPDGCELHVCFGTDGDLRVSEIWDSRERFEAFGKDLMPILGELGIDAGQPEIHEVHNIAWQKPTA